MTWGIISCWGDSPGESSAHVRLSPIRHSECADELYLPPDVLSDLAVTFLCLRFVVHVFRVAESPRWFPEERCLDVAVSASPNLANTVPPPCTQAAPCSLAQTSQPYQQLALDAMLAAASRSRVPLSQRRGRPVIQGRLGKARQDGTRRGSQPGGKPGGGAARQAGRRAARADRRLKRACQQKQPSCQASEQSSAGAAAAGLSNAMQATLTP